MWILGVDWVFECRTIRRFAQPLLTVCVGSLGAGACGWEILTSCLQTLPVSRYFCCRKKYPPGGVNLTAGTFPVGHIGKMSVPRDLLRYEVSGCAVNNLPPHYKLTPVCCLLLLSVLA